MYNQITALSASLPESAELDPHFLMLGWTPEYRIRALAPYAKW
jgi:hypothetical protein